MTDVKVCRFIHTLNFFVRSLKTEEQRELLFPSKGSWEQIPELLRHIWLLCLPVSFRKIFLNPLIILHCCCNKNHIQATVFSSWSVSTSFFQRLELFCQELRQLQKSSFVSLRQLMWSLKPLQDNPLVMPVATNHDYHVWLHHSSCIHKSHKEFLLHKV